MNNETINHIKLTITFDMPMPLIYKHDQRFAEKQQSTTVHAFCSL